MGEWVRHDSVAELVAGLLAQGASVRLRVTGSSMAPCIRSGDVVTLDPPRGGMRLGDVVAVSPHPGHLLVHRLVGRTARAPVTWGDAAPRRDAPAAGGTILGVVSGVQRAGAPVRLGLGPERLLIVFALRAGLLRPLRGLAGRARRLARAGRQSGVGAERARGRW